MIDFSSILPVLWPCGISPGTGQGCGMPHTCMLICTPDFVVMTIFVVALSVEIFKFLKLRACFFGENKYVKSTYM